MEVNSSRIAGFVALALPFVASLVTHIWSNFAVSVLFGEGPSWWPERGFQMGLLPSLLCGLYGLLISIWGFQSRLGTLVAGGIWCCFAAPAIIVLYIVATF